MKPLHIVFCLPSTAHYPTGGTKVVGEYANYLRARGHRVTLVAPAINLKGDHGVHRLYRYGAYAYGRSIGGIRRWFPLRDDVDLRFVSTLDAEHIPDADVVIATFWKTAEWVANYPASKGAKFYLIQHLETWAGPGDRVEATWHSPMQRIVPARWLAKKAWESGLEATHIPNGLDESEFGVDRPISDRDPKTIMMLYHHLPFKGSRDGIAALDSLRSIYPDLVVQVFGANRRPRLPPGFHYVRRPSRSELRAMYNRSAIFIAPSLSEGWDLPATEAMLCGCALVASDVDGHWEYAQHATNSLLFPAGDVSALANAVRSLIDDDEYRRQLAEAGLATVRNFTWPRAVQAFEETVLGSCSEVL